MTEVTHSNVTVTEIVGRPWQNKTLYSFRVAGISDSFGAGEYTPKFQQGSVISFSAKQNGKGYWNALAKTVVVVQQVGTATQAQQTEPAASSAPAAAAPPPIPIQKPTDWAAKDKRYQEIDVPRMSFSAAQERATHLIAAALVNDTLALGATKGKKLDLLLGYVDQVADRFFLQSMDAHNHYKVLLEQEKELAAAHNVADTTDFVFQAAGPDVGDGDF